MSCPPSYTYTPTDRPTPAKSFANIYTEHRSRLFASGTFFRSIEQGTAENGISVETIVTEISAPYDFEVTCNVYILDVLQEVFVVPQIIVPQPIPNPPVCTGGISALRTKINADSNIIEMPARNFDIFDPLPNADPVNNCVNAFGPINMAGGSGPPSTANQAFLDSLFTGTERSIS